MDRNQTEQLSIATKELGNIRYALDQSAIVAITDRAGNITHVNDKFCKISRYAREELLGKNHRIINSGHHSPEFFVDLWKTISRGEIWEGEIRNHARDGTFYWVNTTIVPFLDEHGEPYQYVSIRYEITQRKVAEERLKVYADRLEASNRELQDFASVAAHDLQEPLRKVEAFGNRLHTKFGGVLGDDGKDYLQRMMVSASRMRRLIEDLLIFSRVTTRAKAFGQVDLDGVLSDVLSDLEVRIEQSGGKVEVSPLPKLDGDTSQMHQLFQNLVANALKFHKLGEAPLVQVSAAIEGDSSTISVKDNGIGFDEKYLDRIFTIFQRLHGRKVYEGTGVGLAVCRRIAERHGGSITATSLLGQGSTFIVTLPLKQRQMEESP